jgi:hypothetical protein
MRDDNAIGTDSTAVKILRANLGVVLESISVADNQYRAFPTSQNATALRLMIDESRQLAADLRDLLTSESNFNQIIERVVHKNMRTIGFQIAQAHSMVIDSIRTNLPPRERKIILARMERATDKITNIVTEGAAVIQSEIAGAK